MVRFLLILVVVAAIVIGVLYYSGYDVVSQLTDDVNVKSYLPPKSFTTNVVAGLVSGFIVAILGSMLARR